MWISSNSQSSDYIYRVTELRTLSPWLVCEMKPTDSETSIIFSSICQKNRDQRLILSKEAGSSVQRPASPIHMLIGLEKTTCFQANQQEFPVDWDANLIGWDPWWLGPIKRNVSFPVVVLRTWIPRIYWLKILSHLTFAFVSPSRVIFHVCISITRNTVLNWQLCFSRTIRSLQSWNIPLISYFAFTNITNKKETFRIWE